ncbi:Ig-like domain-containing protein [Bradyrhizobium sp. LHD-71]|uniref:Ig-like domain-containing protein n=1 Tax=Bradyrhizobium sp. LHD-71 TaxID=3072141 RepID=UPI00280D73BA|nr:Ig-like domain-containing protein [Bradyrhizobium sp. LHD-71]MDQ8728060.1 Ig-like domain-containing protein [Bradyrhizobium sp. LHD-71]
MGNGETRRGLLLMAISLSEIIKQNTRNLSEGFPEGVPQSWDWYKGWEDYGIQAPPSNFTAVEGWGAVYHQEGTAPTNPNANVEVANSKTYVHLKETNQWVLVQDQSKLPIAGAHFVPDFAGNAGKEMDITTLSNGVASFDAPPDGYNDHFWYQSRGTYLAGTVDGVYVQMDMRVTEANANVVAMVGADWWRNSTAPYLDDHSNNPVAGNSNWVELSTQWRTLGYYSMSNSEFQNNLPPPLQGSVGNPPSDPDTTAPATPTITGFSPDTETVGDGVTSANRLTLSGKAEPESVVKIFDGSSQIGTATANKSGTWSFATAQLSNATHSFRATATDAAGNTSAASARLNVQVQATSTPPPSNGNLLVNGSFEATTVAAGEWSGSQTLPGWTALSGSRIELWNNHVGVRATDGSNFGELDFGGAEDGFYQTVKTVAGQSYDLSFDSRSRPGFGAATSTIEVWWNDKLIASVPPGSNWSTYSFKVTGTGGQDKLTFREADGQSRDGLGALYDNVSLTAAKTPEPPTNGSNLLQNGSFEATTVAAHQWDGFNSLPGWTAVAGGMIELWNNVNGVRATDGSNFGELDVVGARDGLYQTVQTNSGQRYELSFDARSRPDSPPATGTIEVLWNDTVVARVPPGGEWETYNFTVTGTGGQDRLTFREAQGQSGDGHGALYDNVSLVAVSSTNSATSSAVAQMDRALDMMTQYSATTLAASNSAPNGVFNQAGSQDSLTPTLTQTHQLT